jgi:hypothetical protein
LQKAGCIKQGHCHSKREEAAKKAIWQFGKIGILSIKN